MIATDTPECPAWIRELVRFLPLKNLLFCYGNIHDRISCPVHDPATGVISWLELEPPQFFTRFLNDKKYEVIGSFDPVDGLTFCTPDMEGLYKKLQSGKPVAPPSGAATPPPVGASIPPVAAGKGSSPEGCLIPEANDKEDPGKGGVKDPSQVMKGMRVALSNNSIPCAFVVNLASRLVTSPSYLAEQEKALFTQVLKASLTARTVVRPDGGAWNNALILICDKLNDLPTFLYLNNPRARSIHIPKPDASDRHRFIQRTYRAFHKTPGTPDAEPSPELQGLFTALTDGLTYYELWSLVSLSRLEKEPLTNIRKICERYKYGVTDSEWDKIDRVRLEGAESFIRARVKGQNVAVAAVLDIVKRAKIGLSAGSGGVSSRPRGVLFFAGPTGVGKTEMAKTLAELLFGQEDRCIRFDMSEYSAPQSDQRLLGAPPGYVGYEEGGQLTKAVRENPFSILLFDEIEKAHGSIFDKFLQILDDGRLTDGKGETVYFSESIIIFTSNLGTVADDRAGKSQLDELVRLLTGNLGTAADDCASGHQAMVTPDLPYHQMREAILSGIRHHFNYELKRPEILNRFGENFVVFDFIRPPLDEQIVDVLLDKLKKASREGKGIELIIEPAVRTVLITLARQNLEHGGRGIRNIVDAALVNPLSRSLFDMGLDKNVRLRLLELTDNGEEAAVRFTLKIQEAPCA